MVHFLTTTPEPNPCKGYVEDSRCVECDAIATVFVGQHEAYDAVCVGHLAAEFVPCHDCGEWKRRDDVREYCADVMLCGQCWHDKMIEDGIHVPDFTSNTVGRFSDEW